MNVDLILSFDYTTQAKRRIVLDFPPYKGTIIYFNPAFLPTGEFQVQEAAYHHAEDPLDAYWECTYILDRHTSTIGFVDKLRKAGWEVWTFKG